ncbi:MAG: phosphatidylglycerophosphatase A [Proteobacteria bacterium]|nr:phosphatidylglycerophosphatase A [Pseudomonadota bacterium]MBU1686062.1 phosphatidylglycerophosphatase A [Pseudomonadota bacterium]
MDRLIMAIATGFGLGYLPKAPGTWGTLLGLPIYLALARLSLPDYLIALAIIIVVAVLTAGSAEKILDRADPGAVVIDEVAGLLVTLIGAPVNPIVLALGFIYFRIFDITKPFPANFFDKNFHGGLGIVLDDLMAGLYALILLQATCRLFGLN